jgi:hypothetical protein
MYDPDIEDEMEAIEAVNIYEWTLTDGTHPESFCIRSRYNFLL